MGLDFIRKTAASFHKSLDRKRAALGIPDLFTRQPVLEPRTYIARMTANVSLRIGDVLSVRLQDGAVLAIRGFQVVATFEAPPNELVLALEASYFEAHGTIMQVYETAEMVDITVC